MVYFLKHEVWFIDLIAVNNDGNRPGRRRRREGTAKTDRERDVVEAGVVSGLGD